VHDISYCAQSHMYTPPMTHTHTHTHTHVPSSIPLTHKYYKPMYKIWSPRWPGNQGLCFSVFNSVLILYTEKEKEQVLSTSYTASSVIHIIVRNVATNQQ